MKARIKFRKNGVMKFIGHLDMMRYFQKAMRRAAIPIAFSGGYSPHMIMSFAHPLGVGLTSDAEYFDIELIEPIPSRQAVVQLNKEMVEGIEVVSFQEIPDHRRNAGMAIVAAADYLAVPAQDILPDGFGKLLADFYALPEIMTIRKTKKNEVLLNIRPLIYELSARDEGVFMRIAAGSVQNLKPELVMNAFLEFIGMTAKCRCSYHRLEVYAISGDNNFTALDKLGNEIV